MAGDAQFIFREGGNVALADAELIQGGYDILQIVLQAAKARGELGRVNGMEKAQMLVQGREPCREINGTQFQENHLRMHSIRQVGEKNKGAHWQMEGVERVPVHIPGVQVVGEFPIKRFLETIYNAAAKQYGVKLTATVYPQNWDERAAEIGKGADKT